MHKETIPEEPPPPYRAFFIVAKTKLSFLSTLITFGKYCNNLKLKFQNLQLRKKCKSGRFENHCCVKVRNYIQEI
ncbi:hypothetical protein CDAR_225091 [Caerostris darwini]|uniref:Uncharacterized protein n=1 Tax=Caerostris darwini TaxID=1538125 RepID=A0AAV4T6N6_9ARAC|nr:hypothetical protein CDAR_225091 [Caerostris darwini]